ncbi:hypothetical protein GUJ93_ZPchr0003g18019 [Zizania palustris]|uniref:Uncharacterized protein n=1 Tax=Zizania palustris TaxID=103762 RepID=A0A8J5S0Y2_ZIZPA|nr:hypothetical protein GUJ93_ZPchr0003g18019 [Zizania palustris]
MTPPYTWPHRRISLAYTPKPTQAHQLTHRAQNRGSHSSVVIEVGSCGGPALVIDPTTRWEFDASSASRESTIRNKLAKRREKRFRDHAANGDRLRAATLSASPPPVSAPPLACSSPGISFAGNASASASA